MLKRLALLFALTVSVGLFAQETKPTVGQQVGQTVDKVVDGAQKVGEVAKDVTTTATQAAAKAVEGPNPNLERALQFLDTVGAKLGAAGSKLLAAYGKYLMAEALAWVVGSLFFAVAFFTLAGLMARKRKLYLAETGPGGRHRSEETLGMLSFASVAPVFVGLLIIGWAVTANLGTILAPEGAVIQKVLDNIGHRGMVR